MNAYQAQRIRFGILAARHTLARGTMTPDQVDYLEGCEAHGWIIGDAGTVKAFDETCKKIREREARADLWDTAYMQAVRDIVSLKPTGGPNPYRG